LRESPVFFWGGGDVVAEATKQARNRRAKHPFVNTKYVRTTKQINVPTSKDKDKSQKCKMKNQTTTTTTTTKNQQNTKSQNNSEAPPGFKIGIKTHEMR